MLSYTDPANLPESSYEHHPMEDIEPQEEAIYGMAEAFRRVMMEIRDAENSKKAAETFLIATGDPASSDESMAACGKKYGVGKADISKCCVAWCKFLGIAPSRHLRSAEAKKSFQLHNYRPKAK